MGIPSLAAAAPMSAPTSPSGRAGTPLETWRFHILAEIANFAALRRRLGRGPGELIVQDVVARLAAALPGARVDAVARDLVEIDATAASAEALDAALVTVRQACAAPFARDGHEYRIEVLLGATRHVAGGDEVSLVEEAERALAVARLDRPLVLHEADASNEQAGRLAAELERALERDEMVLMYQPKIHVRRQEITSAEALIRWQHPERGLIQPGDFIPAAEQAQQIDRLTLWTIRRAIRDQRTLREGGHDLRIFINISGQLLADQRFVEAACVLVAGCDASLGFEVTETSVIRDPASAIANLQRFADIGILIAIDDYGAGLSSLAYLKQLPARELKIDKLFITQLTSSNRDPLIVRSTIDLAHALEMEVVAEGVETHAALALLTVMGCDMVQGFLISRPIPLPALFGFLKEDRNHRSSQETRASFTRLASAWKRA